MNRRPLLAAGLAIGFVAAAGLFTASRLLARPSAEQVAQDFFNKTYRHDFAAAWELVSSADQAARSKADYVAANGVTNAVQAALYDQLASWGEFQVLALVSSQPELTTVSAQIRYPDSAQPEFVELVEQAVATNASPNELIGELRSLYQAEQLQFVESDVGITLVLEDNQWRVLQNWGRSLRVRLSASVSPNLPWSFYPLESEISARPGEAVKVSYLVRNDSDRTITGMALHELGPPEAASYFQTIECFCFSEQTLAPGEQREMTLLFQIDPAVPAEVAFFRNRYTFYPADEFPEGES